MTKEQYDIIQKHPHRLRIKEFGGEVLFDAVLPLGEAWATITYTLNRNKAKKHYSISLMPE